MDFADDFVVDDPVTFFYFLRGNLLQIYSGLEVILGCFCFTEFGVVKLSLLFFFTNFGLLELSRDYFTKFGVLELFRNCQNPLVL